MEEDILDYDEDVPPIQQVSTNSGVKISSTSSQDPSNTAQKIASGMDKVRSLLSQLPSIEEMARFSAQLTPKENASVNKQTPAAAPLSKEIPHSSDIEIVGANSALQATKNRLAELAREIHFSDRPRPLRLTEVDSYAYSSPVYLFDSHLEPAPDYPRLVLKYVPDKALTEPKWEFWEPGFLYPSSCRHPGHTLTHVFFPDLVAYCYY